MKKQNASIKMRCSNQVLKKRHNEGLTSSLEKAKFYRHADLKKQVSKRTKR
jgi:hypothetical protein